MGLELHRQLKFYIHGPLCFGSLCLCKQATPKQQFIIISHGFAGCLGSAQQFLLRVSCNQPGLQSPKGSARLDIQDDALSWLAVDAECWSGTQLRLSPRAPTCGSPHGLGFSQHGGWFVRESSLRASVPRGRIRSCWASK